MRLVVKHPNGTLGALKRTKANDARLMEYLAFEHEAGFTARRPQDMAWNEGRRQYAAIPKSEVRNQPIPNAPNIEFPLGGIICDSLYAQATDALYQASPILTARELDDKWTDHAKALQKFINWIAANELDLRHATDNAFQDDIQLGTGVLYIPWVEETKATVREKVTYCSPRVIPIPTEDFLVPGGSRGDHQQDRFCTLRFWYTLGEFKTQARAHKWKIDGVMPTAQVDQVRLQHEMIGRTSSTAAWREMYEAMNTWVYFDYNGDGVDLDLLCVWDRNSRLPFDVGFNEYAMRPIETMRYQIRPHLFWGLGVMEMVQPFQDSATEIVNHYLLNMMLANARLWVARHGTLDDFTKVWPNKIVGVESTDDIKQLSMADVYSSALNGLNQVVQAAERRVGVMGDTTSGNPASRMLGTRTPGITTSSVLQAVNRRFTPAFDGMRLNTAAAVRQGLWRYSERVRSGNKRAQVKTHILKLMGEREGALVIDLLEQDDFERSVAVEFTAVSGSINRDQDRANALMLMQTMGTYYQRIMEGASALGQQQQPPIVLSAARKVMASLDYSVDSFLRTFDQVRNPQRLLVDLSDELDTAQEEAEAAQAEAAAAEQQGFGSMVQGLLGGGGPMDEEIPPEDGGVPPVA